MCPNGEYSLDQNDTYCNKCPENAECKINGSFINVLPGYWRENYFSTLILECFTREACLGNQCAEGYKGPLCDVCSNNYFKQPQFGCVKCDSVFSYVFFTIVSFSKIN